MQIQITDEKVQDFPTLGRYYFASLTTGSQSITVSIKRDELRIVVENAAHRVWRGIGKTFPTIEAAFEHYRSAGVRALIREAVERAKAAGAQQTAPC